jgi:hypothetical protein
MFSTASQVRVVAGALTAEAVAARAAVPWRRRRRGGGAVARGGGGYVDGDTFLIASLSVSL